MDVFESYLRSLAAELRGNGASERTIAEVLDRVVSDGDLDRSRPELALSAPKQFASTIGTESVRSAGSKILATSLAIGVAIAGVKAVTSLGFNIGTSIANSLVTYGVAIGVLIVGIAISIKVDRRLPKDVEARLRS